MDYFFSQLFYNSHSDSQSRQIQKRVRFYNIVDVVLVPCNEELVNIRNDLWWNENDCNNFFISSVGEINDFIMKYEPNLSFKQGKNMLYQSHVYDFVLENYCCHC